MLQQAKNPDIIYITKSPAYFIHYVTTQKS